MEGVNFCVAVRATEHFLTPTEVVEKLIWNNQKINSTSVLTTGQEGRHMCLIVASTKRMA